MELSDLNNLDLKDIAKAPTAVKALLLGLLIVIILVAGWFLHLSEQMAGLERLEAEEQSLRDVYATKKAQARNLEAYRQQLKEAEQNLAVMLKQLPNKSEIDALLADINQAGVGRGLQFDLFRPGTAAYEDFYATLPVALKVNGGYHDIAGFISDIAHMPRIVTVHDIAINPSKGSALSMDATLKTYRYLDEAESAEHAKKAKPGDKAKGGGAK